MIARLRNMGKVICPITYVEGIISGVMRDFQEGKYDDFNETACKQLATSIEIQDKAQTLPKHRNLLRISEYIE